jgi:hypothetical protein
MYTNIPQLTNDGTARSETRATSDENRVKEAIERIVARGQKVTLALVATEAGIRKAVASALLKKCRGPIDEDKNKNGSQNTISNSNNSKTGTVLDISSKSPCESSYRASGDTPNNTPSPYSKTGTVSENTSYSVSEIIFDEDLPIEEDYEREEYQMNDDEWPEIPFEEDQVQHTEQGHTEEERNAINAMLDELFGPSDEQYDPTPASIEQIKHTIYPLPDVKPHEWVNCPHGVGQVVRIGFDCVDIIDAVGRTHTYRGASLLGIASRNEEVSA